MVDAKTSKVDAKLAYRPWTIKGKYGNQGNETTLV
jgi:hypothetical protein